MRLAAAGLAAVALALAGCGPKIVKPTRLEGWESRAKPGEGVRLRLYTTGATVANRKDVVRGSKPGEIEMPVIVALVEHPQGNVLIDSGWGARHRTHIQKFPASFFQKMIAPKNFDPEKDAAVHQIRRDGIDPASVRWVLLTHMHWDHAGGVQDFPDARLVVPIAEWERAHKGIGTALIRGYAPSMYERPRPEAMLLVWKKRPFATFERSIDLYGDGSIVLVDSNGHTPGSMTIFVTVSSGKTFAFVGDAAWVRDNYRIPAHKGRKTYTLDNGRNGVMQTLWRIKRLEELAPEVTVVPAHDPDVWSELKRAPEAYE